MRSSTSPRTWGDDSRFRIFNDVDDIGPVPPGGRLRQCRVHDLALHVLAPLVALAGKHPDGHGPQVPSAASGTGPNVPSPIAGA
jgi:hypothetical protein